MRLSRSAIRSQRPVRPHHVRRVSVDLMTEFANEPKPLDLNPADASILFVIGSNPGVTQSWVGQILGILRPNMAPLVGSWVRRGHVRRESINGRSQALLLTSRRRHARTAHHSGAATRCFYWHPCQCCADCPQS